MNAARLLRLARRRAGLTQRELAERCSFEQSAVARIESGRVSPRTDTLDKLLRACGERLDAVPVPAEREVDVTQIRERLGWTVQERLDELISGAEAFLALASHAR